jgi:hypothetical protein
MVLQKVHLFLSGDTLLFEFITLINILILISTNRYRLVGTSVLTTSKRLDQPSRVLREYLAIGICHSSKGP